MGLIISWNPLFSYLGLEALYSFGRLNGRYKDIEDELNKERSIFRLSNKDTLGIAWPYLVDFLELFLVRSFYGAAVFAPMTDNAEYKIYLTDTGIELLPSNEEAKNSLKQW